MTCPSRDEWVRHKDGEVTANRASELAAHAGGCSTCRGEAGALDDIVAALRAPSGSSGSAVDIAAATARVMAGLDTASPVAAAPSRRRWWLGGGLGLALAAAAALVIVPRLGANPDDTPQARGARAGVFDHVGVVVHAVGVSASSAELAPIADGARVAPSTAYVASWRNPGEPAFVMVFAIDSARELHWLYPAYTDAASDPVAVQLGTSPMPALFDETVVLEAPAPGAMAIITIVADHALYVSEVERLAPDARTLAAIRARWPAASVRGLTVDVGR